MIKYKHIYFDLDRTLWDFEANSREALYEIFHNYNLGVHFEGPEQFIECYHKHNERLWAQYRDGNLNKEILRSKRFELTLNEKKIKEPGLAVEIGEEYLNMVVLKTHLFPFAKEILEYLKPDYFLYVLTNGFREVQFRKLKKSNLLRLFNEVFTSETIGINKPHREIFHWAVTSVNARKNECIMIGDDQDVDIAGARSYGIHSILFNPYNEQIRVKPTYSVNHLEELKKIF